VKTKPRDLLCEAYQSMEVPYEQQIADMMKEAFSKDLGEE
jgi:hypothetical protein